MIEDSLIQTIPNPIPYSHPNIQTQETDTKQSLTSYYNQLNTRTSKTPFPLIDIMSADKLYVVSDGGLDNDHGYYGWVIATS